MFAGENVAILQSVKLKKFIELKFSCHFQFLFKLTSLKSSVNMPESYNLRSSQKRRNVLVGQCYLHNLLENTSPEVFNPKVRLERLKVLECLDNPSSRFYLQEGRITIKKNKSFLLRKKFWLKMFCSVVLVVSSFYWRDYLQTYGNTLVEKCTEIHPMILTYYSDAVKYQQRLWKQFNSKPSPKPKKQNEKSTLSGREEELNALHDSFQIRKLVRDYLAELKKKNKIQSRKEEPSFIEDQCRSNIKDKFISVKNSFYNVTVPDLANFTDYALESQGAKIVSVFNTELYGTITVKLFNFDLWPQLGQFIMKYFQNVCSKGPKSILVPWKKPGDCWAFKGSQGRVQIKLSKKITITAVSIDHIPKDAAPHGSIQSAPKKFSVIGVDECENQPCNTYLGSYEYKIGGPSTQTFIINPSVEVAFERVEIVIESNHGNNEYTCVYKIRVHGY